MLTILSRSFATKGSGDVGWKLEGEMRSREGFFKKHWRHNSMFACWCERPAERKFHHVGKEGQD